MSRPNIENTSKATDSGSKNTVCNPGLNTIAIQENNSELSEAIKPMDLLNEI